MDITLNSEDSNEKGGINILKDGLKEKNLKNTGILIFAVSFIANLINILKILWQKHLTVIT